MPRTKNTIRLISKITGELAVTTLDLVILTSALAGGFIMFGPRGKDLYYAKHIKDALRAADFMYEKWDQSKFRRAVGRAVAEGLLKRISNGFALTQSGKKRLRQLLPSYKQPLKWDGKLWLITYDIKNDKPRSRDKFRHWLETIGCRMIQESVWLSVKDPRGWVKDSSISLKKNSIIVSCLGKDGFIGNDSLPDLISRVFDLNRLNKGYQRWIKATEVGSRSQPQIVSLGWRYLYLLRQDPVLPIELLPNTWAGNRARQIFETQIEPHMGSIDIHL